MITQFELKQILTYDSKTGLFHNKEGSIVGHRNPLGYVRIYIKSKLYSASRLAWLYETGEWPKKEIDHINGVRDDNRFDNLREASRSQNCYNKSLMSNNTSGHKGVSWRKSGSCWQAIITVNKKQKHLGYFSDLNEAIEARKKAEKTYHGEFARKNGEHYGN